MTSESNVFTLSQSALEAVCKERDEAQAKLKEAKELMNDAMWQLMIFLKPADTKTQGIIKKLQEALV
jgi:predicted deacetylase